MDTAAQQEEFQLVGILLNKWGFGKFVQAFREAEIDMEALQYISDSDLKELMVSSSLGQRIKFKKAKDLFFSSEVNLINEEGGFAKPISDVPGIVKCVSVDNAHFPDKGPSLKRLRTEEVVETATLDDIASLLASPSSGYSTQKSVDVTEETEPTTSRDFVFDDLYEDAISFSATDNGSQENSKPETENAQNGSPRNSKPVTVNAHDGPQGSSKSVTVELREVLTDSKNTGGNIIAACFAEGKLNGPLRGTLSHICIKHWITKSPEYQISRLTFLAISEAIVELFPKEVKETYFVPSSSSKTGGKKCAQGKLWNCYTRLRSDMIKNNLLAKRGGSSNKSSISETSASGSDLPNVDKELEWLKNSQEPWITVADFWRKTYAVRRQILENFSTKSGQTETDSVYSYMRTFPALLSPQGYTLLEIDFECLYPEHALSLFSAWKQFSSSFLEHLKKRKTKPSALDTEVLFNDELSSDEKVVPILHAIPVVLLPHSTRPKGRKGNHWRPSLLESQQGFVLHIKTLSELQPALQARREKLRSLGLTAQPVVVVV